MKKIIRIVCLILTLALLTGCTGKQSLLGGFGEEVDRFWREPDYVAFSDMEYTRPDMVQLKQKLEDAILASEKDNLALIMDRVYEFYDVYDGFYTNYYLADIHYCSDLTDMYWEDEYNFCLENSAAVDGTLEELYYALAKSPALEELEGEEYFGPGFFDSYQGENNWDATFTAMLEEESRLQTEYYALSEIAIGYEYGSEEYYDACGKEMIRVLLDLIRLRQEIAAYWGYPDYVQFATDFYYYRDYTPGQSEAYLQDVCRELVPLYREYAQSSKWDLGWKTSTEAQTYEYVKTVAESMGGTVKDAFELMEKAQLYDISYSPNKYNSSFELYLPTYYQPYVFLCPQQTVFDQLTFAHEFGHFCNDYASYGSYAGIDVMEVFSQGMEYLSLSYAGENGDMVWLKMADCLSLMVEQSAYAAFEQQMYALTGEELTEENLRALYEEVALAYGFDAIGYTDWEFVTINHYYTNPMYIISYVVSNDAALQLYQMEREEPGAGFACYQENLDTQCSYFLEFLEEAGLESPFEEGRVAAIRRTLEESLK